MLGCRSFDVAVIGAGPAGSTTAALLAQRGITAAILDRSEFPRDKLCGGFVSYDAKRPLETIGAWARIAALGANPIRRARVTCNSSSHEFQLPPEALAISRRLLDNLLLDAAIARGAIPVTHCTVTDVTFDGHWHTLHLITPNGDEIIRARVTIGAWGRWSRLDFTHRRAFTRHHRRWFGVAQYGARRPALFRDRVDLYGLHGGYLGVAEVDGDRANYCALLSEADLPRGDHIQGWLPTLISKNPSLNELVETVTDNVDEDIRISQPVIFVRRETVVNHILLVGDASVLIPPVAGSGIAAAVQASLLAAGAAIRILRHPQSRELIEYRYAGEIHGLTRARTLWAHTGQWLLRHPNQTAAVMRLARTRFASELLMRQTRLSDAHLQSAMQYWSTTDQ